MDGIHKLKKLFFSPAVKSLPRWAACVRGKLFLICLLNGLITLLSLFEILAMKRLIDSAVGSSGTAIWLWGACVAALMLAVVLLNTLLSLLEVKTSARLQRSMQETVLQEILAREYKGLAEYHSGELLNRYFSDVEIVEDGIMQLFPDLVSTSVSFFGAALILFRMDWRFLPLLVLGGFISLSAVFLFRNPMKRRHVRMQQAEDRMRSAAQEMLEHILLIKASVSEKRVQNFVGRKQKGLENEQVRKGRLGSLLHSGVDLIFNVSWFLCVFWCCIRISQGVLTYGSLIAIVQLVSRVEGPIAGLMDMAGSAYGIIASAERLQELHDLPEEEAGPLITDFDAVRLEGVSFRYEDDAEMVLKELDWTFDKGSCTALTGMSGEGKTSLFHLLLGIYKPTEGQICILQGQQKMPVTRDSRHLFAYVPQGNTLFSGTIRDNLLMFTDEASDDELLEACRIACIDELVETAGLDMVLGEKGLGLSEGQAQRISIARALLSKAPILLLDECTSALDEETEARLLENLSSLKDKTSIIVTHRRAALSICGSILRIRDGRLIEVSRAGGVNGDGSL